MKNVLLILLLVTASSISAQFDLPNLEQIESLELQVYWGDVTVLGRSDESAAIEINYTDSENNKRELTSAESGEFVTIEQKGRAMFITAREPTSFESIDVTLFIPERIQVNIELVKGGEILYGPIAHEGRIVAQGPGNSGDQLLIAR